MKLSNKSRRKIFICFVIIFLCSISFFVGKSYGYEKKEVKTMTVLVQRGDTLWEIAKKYSNGNNTAEKVYKIREANNMKTSDIYIGTELIIPVEA
jgi:nucleoid-associated protein YgaU